MASFTMLSSPAEGPSGSSLSPPPPALVPGITIVRGDVVTKIGAQDGGSVTVEAGEKPSFRGKWLIAYDGRRRGIRKVPDFTFVGTGANNLVKTADVVKHDLDCPHILKPGGFI
jgi:2-polyprenyl-6-methoxyphenol hydroxylase-like FAD-dependent oxidoreductase